MKNIKQIILLAIFILPSLLVGQNDSVSNKLLSFVENINIFSKYVPQEKVYLHLDNTDYFLGETVWFKAYVATSKLNAPSDLSKVLYVEILTPEGRAIKTQKYKLENGQCSGNIVLDLSLFYSGFHEIRAYTRYMTNFDSDAVFSRVIPIYNSPKKVNDYTERKISGASTKRESFRPKSEKREDVNVQFFPQGGKLIAGLENKVAFKVTDKQGRPLNANATIYNSKKEEILTFTSVHQGMGDFVFIPDENWYSAKVETIVKDKSKTKTFYLPKAEKTGYVMDVNNLEKENVHVHIQRSNEVDETQLGLVTLVRGEVCDFVTIDFASESSVDYAINKKKLPSGVGQLVLFNSQGKVLSDRLLFTKREDIHELEFTVQQDKNIYLPFEKVSMNFQVKDKDNPIETSFSLSVRDRNRCMTNLVENDLYVDMLLSSDLRGYIQDPYYYFEDEDKDRLYALDLLMMTQGWRRYKWEHMTGLSPMDAKQFIEKGIMIDGAIRSRIRKNAKPGLDLSIMMTKRDTASRAKLQTLTGECITGEEGQFAFMLDQDIQGTWNTVIQAKDKGKNKDNRIMLNRMFSPDRRFYRYFDTEIIPIEREIDLNAPIVEENTDRDDENLNDILPENNDKLGITEKTHTLKEVIITENKSTRWTQQRLTANHLVYDVREEYDNLIDKGDEEYDMVMDYLTKIDPNFRISYSASSTVTVTAEITYKGRPITFVMNNKLLTEQAWESPENVSMSRIKKLSISDGGSLLPVAKFDDNGDDLPQGKHISLSAGDVNALTSKHPVYVFLYTYHDYLSVSSSKGTRLTTIQGYEVEKEFYSPVYDYDISEIEGDHRRTLYWDPHVKTDKDGNAQVEFYNNDSQSDFIINAETMTTDGKIGIYTE